MQHWWPVGMGLVLAIGTITLQTLRWGEKRTILKTLQGRHHTIGQVVNSDKQYGMMLTAIVAGWSLGLLLLNGTLATSLWINVIITVAVFIYWLRQPEKVEVYDPIYPD